MYIILHKLDNARLALLLYSLNIKMCSFTLFPGVRTCVGIGWARSRAARPNEQTLPTVLNEAWEVSSGKMVQGTFNAHACIFFPAYKELTGSQTVSVLRH